MDKAKKILDELIARYPDIASCKDGVWNAFLLLNKCFSDGHKLLACGNGGSSADADHMVGELMKKFKRKRNAPSNFIKEVEKIDPTRASFLSQTLEQPLPAISLSHPASLLTAFSNDVPGGDKAVFAQQVYGYGQKGDVLFAITTSGNSENVLLAALTAKAMGIPVIALTGRDGGEIKEFADVAIVVPEQETYKIQERHLPIYHALCLMLEETFFA